MRVDSLSPGTRAISTKGHRLTVLEHLPTGKVRVRLDGREEPIEVAGSAEATPESPAPEAPVRLDSLAQLRAAATAEGRKPHERRADVAAILRHMTSAEIEEAAEQGLPLWCEHLVREEVSKRAAKQADQRTSASVHLDKIRDLQEQLRTAADPQAEAEAARELLVALQAASAAEPAREGVWSQARALAQSAAQRAAQLIAGASATQAEALAAVAPLVEALIPDAAIALAGLRAICPDVSDDDLARLAPHLRTSTTAEAASRLNSGLTAADLDVLIRLERGQRARKSVIQRLIQSRDWRVSREIAAAAQPAEPVAETAAPDAQAAPESPEAVADVSEPPPEAPAAQSVQDAQPEAPPETWTVMERPDGMDRFARRPGRPVELVDEVRYLPSGVVIQTTRPGAADRCALVVEAASARGLPVEIRGAESGSIAPRPPPQAAPSLDQAIALARTLAERAGFALTLTLSPLRAP